MSHPNSSDEVLMMDYQKGSKEAFMELYKRYSGRVYGFLQSRISDSSKVDEIFQDVFMRLHKSRLTYKSQHAFAPWLFVITRSAVSDYFRSDLKKSQFELLDQNSVDKAPQSSSNVNLEEFDGLVESLSDREKEVLKLRYQEDLEFEDIAKQLNLSSSNVRQVLSRATRKLSALFPKKNNLGGNI